MKILVTGAAGFIGYHLVNKLHALGHQVVGIDNINNYYDVNLKYRRLLECGIDREGADTGNQIKSAKYPGYSFKKIDIVDLTALNTLFSTEKFDMVVNMAAQAGVRYSLENPHAYVSSNLVGFVNLLECCRHFTIKHFVYASSSSVYGMNDKTPFSESDRVDFPVSLYAATKKSNELLAHSYSHLYQLPTTGLRLFTVYGPYGRPDMSPMLFADAIYQGSPIKVFNGGEMQRDFTYVDDIVRGVVDVLAEIPGADEAQPYYRLLNIGNSKPIDLMDFIKILQDAIGISAKLEMYPMQPGDVKITYADTTRLNEIIGYSPKTVLKDGVIAFVNWYKAYHKL
jgi:UDP-glucuronate 4-epimerase